MSAHEEKIDTAAFLAALQQQLQQQPLVLRAIEELKMLAEDPVLRERYEARRRFLLDINAAIRAARMEGRAEGEIGRIHLCERLLQRPLTPTEALRSRSLEDLIQIADALQAEVLNQR